MELKHTKPSHSTARVHLLIVPYGIETPKLTPGPPGFRLLIVPYGIETGIASVSVK